MSSINPPPSSTSIIPEFLTPPSSLLLELGTICLLGAVFCQKTVVEAIISSSQASEEIFRGDRLPILPFPSTNGTHDGRNTTPANR